MESNIFQISLDKQMRKIPSMRRSSSLLSESIEENLPRKLAKGVLRVTDAECFSSDTLPRDVRLRLNVTDITAIDVPAQFFKMDFSLEASVLCLF